MKKYKNWGIDMGGLSMTDPERYRKINYVLNDKGVHIALLDVVETVSLDYVHDLADEGKSPEEETIHSELKKKTTSVLSSLTAREERIIRERFFNGKTLEEVGQTFSVTRDRIRQIQNKALRKLRAPKRAEMLRDFLEAA